jgi:transcriptional regulator with XRE-family HTH domain
MTQEALADTAGLSKGRISKIENSTTSPPVSTLIKIARALKVGLDQLFSEEPPAQSYTLVRAHERQPVARRGSRFGYSFEPLALQFPNRMMDPFILTAPPHAARSAVFSHPGQEMLFILDGDGVVMHIGEEAVDMGVGDCLYFDASIPHFSEHHGRGGRALVVIYTPDGDDSRKINHG